MLIHSDPVSHCLISNLSLCPVLLASDPTLIDIIRVLSEVLFNLSADDLSPDGLASVQLQACLIFRLESFIRGSIHEQKRFYFT